MGWEQPKLEDDKDKVLEVDGEVCIYFLDRANSEVGPVGLLPFARSLPTWLSWRAISKVFAVTSQKRCQRYIFKK